MPLDISRRPSSSSLGFGTGGAPVIHASPRFTAAMLPDGKTYELCIYESIGESWDGPGLTTATVKKELEAAGRYSKLSVRINSPGGDATHGLGVMNLIKSTGVPVDVWIDGVAASAASIIAMCGSTITMWPNSLMMLHNSQCFAGGDWRDHSALVATLKKVDSAIASSYTERTGQPLSIVSKMMDDETWLSASDALAKGFCTRIEEQPAEQSATAMAMARGFKAFKHMRHVPPELRLRNAEEVCECECENCRAGDCASCTNAECEDPNCLDCPMQLEGASANTAAGFVALHEAHSFLTRHVIKH